MGAEGAADEPCGSEVAPIRSDGRAAGLSVAQLCQAANQESCSTTNWPIPPPSGSSVLVTDT